MQETLVLAASSELEPLAVSLAEAPGLRFGGDASKTPAGDSGFLLLTEDGLELRSAEAKGALRIDLLGGKLGWRLKHGGGKGQAIARAVGLKSGRPAPRVLDATAGLGRDSAVLASLGCKVVAVERHPAVHALLADALRRAGEHFEGRLEVLRADARSLLLDLPAHLSPAQLPEVILVDPMHPPRRKSALPKIEMRLFRALLGEDPDQAELLRAALQCGARRVVVKRPADRPPLEPAGAPLGIQPHHSVDGRTTRFDVYLPAPTR